MIYGFISKEKLIIHLLQNLVVKKQIKNINQMKNISFDKNETYIQYSKKTFIYDFLSSMRQKINDPLGKRKR